MNLPAPIQAVWDELVAEGYRPGPGFEAYCGQVHIERDAARRVATEGLVIADAKGAPIAHPAIEAQRRAQVEIRAWGKTFAPRASR